MALGLHSPSSRARLLKSIVLVVASGEPTLAGAAASEPAENFLEASFLDATGVLVGQSGGMENTRHSKS